MANKLVKEELSSAWRDESKFLFAPAWVIYTMPLFVITMIICAALVVYNFFNCKPVSNSIAALSVFVGCAIWGIFNEYVYQYHQKCQIIFDKDYITYKFDLNKSVIPSGKPTVEVKIKDLSKVFITKKSVIFYGKISKTSPFKRTKHLRKIKLPINGFSQEVIDKIKSYENKEN